MKTVILCNQLGRLVPFLNRTIGPLRYLILAETRESRRICDYLGQRPGAKEIPKGQLLRERSEQFRQQYVEFISRLNSLNRCRQWWAMRFTNKNPLSTPLCRNTAYFLLIVELLRSGSQPLLVVTDSADLVAQTKALSKGEGLKVVNLVKVPRPWRRLLKLHTPAGIIRASLRTFLLWLLSRRHKPARNTGEPHLVIATLTHPRSFPLPHGYRDAYFGSLLEHVSASGAKALVLGSAVERPFRQLEKFNTMNYSLPVVPLEACLTFKNYLACTLLSLATSVRAAKPGGPMEINGVDVGCLVRRAVAEARHSGDLFLNLRVYYCANWLARNVWIERCIYPFENRSWEKMLLLGVGAASPRTRMVGYQHASLTMSHTNFMLGPEEAHFTPLPAAILTTGRRVTDWLETEGKFPPGIVKTACALRQSQPVHRSEKRTREGNTRILVALATSMEEYVKTLSFLEQALGGVVGCQLRIRPHPEFPLEPALAIAPLNGTDWFSQSTGPLADDLAWADVILYASSTVGLEAVSMGIPAVHLDLGGFLDTDPMSGWNELRWSAKEPWELAGIIESINELPQAEFRARQDKARKYVSTYLTPVADDALRAFLEA